MTGDVADEERSGYGVSASDVERLEEEICRSDADWKRDVTIDLGSKKWHPNAVDEDARRLLYVFLADVFPRFVTDRLRLARGLGWTPHVALHIRSLFQPEVLAVLAETDAQVLVVDDPRTDQMFAGRNLLAALADLQVPVPHPQRVEICEKAYARLGDGSSYERGRRLEALLAFVFSQVADLRVFDRNYRTETEEIDIVLQIDNTSPRVWQKSGVPFILVESKNTKEKASQPMVSIMLTKLQTKRGSARIALMVSISGFTEDARAQELRYSTQDICIAMIDDHSLKEVIGAKDLDTALERIVSEALLR